MENNYIALARKYRPVMFSELIGQDVLVQTLSNAVLFNHIPQATVLAGTRGVGKTTTARILAKSINCIGVDGNSGPTVTPCNTCHNCVMITESRHQDVIEMDAASNTSVNDIRIIIENSAYKPVTARYKVYIIDEVHMLSNSAFNALLKILEEPPLSLKFIFATTEIRKIPITILSRCQRFDLRRIPIQRLSTHYMDIIRKEGATADPDALNFIAKAADGSVRDGLSILDQAIALGNGQVTLELVSSMLGLNNQENVWLIFKALSRGEIKQALEMVANIYECGVEPIMMANDLLGIIHMVTKANIGDIKGHLTELEMRYLNEFKSLSIPYLSRLWQVLLKGIEELKASDHPSLCLEMIIVKLGYLNIAKTPEQILNDLASINSIGNNAPHGSGLTNIQSAGLGIQEVVQPDAIIAEEIEYTPQQLLDLLYDSNELELYYMLYSEVSILELKKYFIKISYKNTFYDSKHHLVLQKTLSMLTGNKWTVEVIDLDGQTLHEANMLHKQRDYRDITNHELVQVMLKTFSGSKIVEIIHKDN